MATEKRPVTAYCEWIAQNNTDAKEEVEREMRAIVRALFDGAKLPRLN